jgi:hypothetical protein
LLTVTGGNAGTSTGLTAIGDTIFAANYDEVDSYNLSTAAFKMYNLGGVAIVPDAGRLLVTGLSPLTPATAPPGEIRSFDPTQASFPYGLQVVTNSNGNAVGTGPQLFAGYGIGIGAGGQIFVNSNEISFASPNPPLLPGQILSVDPLTGNRTILSDATHGVGPTFVNPLGMYVVPEPSTIVLAAFGGLVVLTRMKSSSRRAAG